MIYKTKAIVLHKSDWKESSLLVRLLTEEIGIISAIAQGAKKNKSPYHGHFELGNSLNIVLMKKETAQIYKITDSFVTHSSLNTNSYPYLLSVQTVLEIFNQIEISEDETPSFFNLLLTFLDYIPTIKNNHLLIIWRLFIRLTDLLGFPLICKLNGKFELQDKNEFFKLYDDNFQKTIQGWLDILPIAGKLVNNANILNESCFFMNKLFLDYFNLHLNKKFHHKALDLFELYISDLN